MSKAKSIDPNNQWWTPHLKDMRNKVIKHYELYKYDKKNQRLEQDYRKNLREYKQKRKAKKNFQLIQNETIANEKAMTKNIKNITTSIQPKVTTLKLPSGDYTEVGQDTCKELMKKHFPTHTERMDPEYNHNKIQ